MYCPYVQAVVEAVVRIYVRRMMRLAGQHENGPGQPIDSVCDAVMDHYTAQRSPGAFAASLLQDMNGSIARLLRSCRLYRSDVKVATFLGFAQVANEAHHDTPAFQFFLQVTAKQLPCSYTETCRFVVDG
jgi:hypothetical protein